MARCIGAAATNDHDHQAQAPAGPPMTLGNMCGRGMHYLIGSCLVLILSSLVS